ncbi:EAL domain-containing protein [Stakelama saccharophila]|uniref:EAL domain-containing protein n=1 Tax=Stakelama saccharophila TaxID=3075605 RepID=A0ABZ0B6K8_9SPHN|nr:EAL domain-containing protein [Stakelama sp. W311]WNO53024.1 EAL domain-containing protein [Stakelama sp. W311]
MSSLERPLTPSSAANCTAAASAAEPPVGSILQCLLDVPNYPNLRRALGVEAVEGKMAALRSRLSAALGAPLERVAQSRFQWFLSTTEEATVGQIVDQAEQVARELDKGIRTRMGVAWTPASNPDPTRLVETAEAALERAQPSRYVVIEMPTALNIFDSRSLLDELPDALGAGQMFMEYQPKVHLREQRISGIEALIRWRHPQHGKIFPNQFIRAAELDGQIRNLTSWTLRRVVGDQAVLREAGHDLPIFVNMSGTLLADGAFVDETCEMLASCNGRIGIEITETAVIQDPAIALRHLQRMVDIGVPLAIDDYGAGLSSLAYLKQLPASELKIDKMFITQLTSSNRDPLIVRSTIDLAHAMEMEVTAEGVETPAAMALLSVMGCDMVQGYLISHPLELDRLKPFLNAGVDQEFGSALRQRRYNEHSFWKAQRTA